MFHRSALVVAHPGHELRVFGWMSRTRPTVHILTDGSGAANRTRIPSSMQLIDDLGARCGAVFPAATDGELYRALLRGDDALFLDIAERLAFSFLEDGIDSVAGDAAEGFNPAHDVCRALINAAVSMAQARSGRAIANWQFSLAEWAGDEAAIHDGRCRHAILDDTALNAKMQAAYAYRGLEAEVRHALDAFGEDYFRQECLRPGEDPFAPPRSAAKPYYESIGEQRVEKGLYVSVIRYGEHVYPVIAKLRQCNAALMASG